MPGSVVSIKSKANQNDYFREVLVTTDRLQLVVMSLEPGEDIGLETHPDTDQFIRIETGEALVVMDGSETQVQAGSAVVVPAGVEHNVTNRSTVNKLKLYTIYTPPHHAIGTIHKTKAEAIAAEA